MQPKELRVVSREGLIVEDEHAFSIAKKLISAAGEAILKNQDPNQNIREFLKQNGIDGEAKNEVLVKTNSLLFQNHLIIQINGDRRKGMRVGQGGKPNRAPLRSRIMCALKDAAPGTKF